MESGTRLFLTLCNCLRNQPGATIFVFPKQRVARGKESVSNPLPNNTPRSGEAGEISCKLRLNKAALLDCRDLSEHVLALEPISRIVSHHYRHRITASMIAYSAILRNALSQSSDSTKTASASDRKAYPRSITIINQMRDLRTLP